MKKINLKLFIVTSIVMISMSTSVFASWWNPSTWFQKKISPVQQVQPIVVPATTNQDIKQEVEATLVGGSNIKKDSEVDPLTTYVFNSYSTSSGQLLVEGELLPTSVQTENYLNQGKVSVVFRCWKKEMYCTFSKQFYKWKLSPQLDLLAVKSWGNNNLIIEGTLGDYPVCGKDSCSRGVKITVDIEKTTATIKETICGSGCAVDEYIVIGDGDGIHKLRTELPKPKVSLVDISF